MTQEWVKPGTKFKVQLYETFFGFIYTFEE